MDTISPFVKNKSEILIACDKSPPGLFLRSKIYPLIFLSFVNSFIFFLTWELLFSLKAVSLIYPILLLIFFDLNYCIFIISLVILKTIAFLTPFLLTVISILEPTGPLIRSTASDKVLP